jgi:hypothetical protein
LGGGFFWVLFFGPLPGLSLVTTALKVSAARLALGNAPMNKIPTEQLNMLLAMVSEAGVSHLLVAFIEFSLPFLCSSS